MKLKKCPASGQGCHNWLFYAACKAVEAGLSNEDAVALIEPLMSRPPGPPSEITDALASARREDREPARRWPRRDFTKIAAIRASAGLPPWVPPSAEGYGWLGAKAPTVTTALAATGILFPGNPLLCIGRTESRFDTKPWNKWGKSTEIGRLRPTIADHSLIVPSPMSAPRGKTKAGHMSAHSLDNTGPRRFIVCELDWGDRNTQLQILWHLRDFAPLAMIVFSGHKSHHGWFYCANESEETVLKFFEYAVSLGCDPRTWLRSQFVRMPGGRRETGEAQPILYFDPEALS